MEQAHSVAGGRRARPVAFAYDGSTTLGRLKRLHVAMDVAKVVMRTVSIDLIRPGTSLRRQFPENESDELAASIREKGMLQPVLVRPRGEAFELIAGERRWRAAQRAGLREIPVIVRPEVTDTEAIEIALIENLQREDLSPIAEAEAYHKLIAATGCSQQDIAKIIGKTESYVSHSMRLLKLPEPVRRRIEAGGLSARHGRLLVAAPNPTALAAEVVRRGLNTLQTEALVQKHAATHRRTSRTRGPATVAFENDLSACLGLRVTLRQGRRGDGTLTLYYASRDRLDHIVGLLRADPKSPVAAA